MAILTAATAERFVRSRCAEEERAREERRAITGRLDEILARLDELEGQGRG